MSVLRADAPFFWPLRGNLALQNGSGSPTFTRATAAWGFNETGKLYKVPSGAVRMRGYRPVINLVTNSYAIPTSFANTRSSFISGQSDPSGGTTAYKLLEDTTASNTHLAQFSAGTQEGGNYLGFIFAKAAERRYIAVRVYVNTTAIFCTAVFDLQTGTQTSTSGSPDDYGITDVGNGWYKIYVRATHSSGTVGFAIAISNAATPTFSSSLPSYSGDGASGLYVWHPMLQNVTAQYDKTPGEYASTGELSPPWHGAGVDGVKYFATYKDGTPIPEANLLGARLSPTAITNNLLWCRDFTNAAWVKTNVTAALTQTGLDGQSNACSLLTATAADGTVLQTITAAASAGCSGFYVKRSAGTGSIYFTRDGGSNWTDITSLINSSTFTLVKIENTSVLNPQVGFKIATSGDAIIVDAGINHLGTQISETPVITTSASVTVNADVLTVPKSGNFSDAAGTILATVTRDDWSAGNGSAVGSATRGLYTSSANSGAQGVDGTNTVNGPTGTPSGTMRFGIRWSGSTMQAFSNGTFGPEGNYDGSFNLGAAMQLLAGVQGAIKDVAIWPSSLSDADMISASKGMTFDGVPASLSMSAPDGVMTIGRTISSAAASLALTAPDSQITIGRTIDADPASLSLIAPDGLMTIGRIIEADAATLTIIAPDGRVLLDDSPRSAKTITATLASPTITARL